MLNKLHVVILAGGGGSRLWPLSRRRHPKQFLFFFGRRSLLQSTYDRVRLLVPPSRIYVVAHSQYKDFVCRQLPQLPKQNLLLEPAAKSTAIAIGLATTVIGRRHPDAIVASLASDHLVGQPRVFHKTILNGAAAANVGVHLVTVGIRPTHPHTGYGYIQRGKKVEGVGGGSVYYVKAFVEKPPHARAEAYLAAKTYFWNASYFIFRVATMRDAFTRHMPHLAKKFVAIERAVDTPSFTPVLERAYRDAEEEPIEYGIFERADNVVVVPGNFPWSDVGDWSVIAAQSAKRSGENVVIGEKKTPLIDIDADDSIIHGNGKLIALVGIEDMVVIDTDDALLVCSKRHAQDVKKVVEKLKRSKKYASYY